MSDEQCAPRDAWESYRRWSIVSYVSGAALAVTTGVLFWMSHPSSSSPRTPTAVQAAVHCGPSPNGISCHGVF